MLTSFSSGGEITTALLIKLAIPAPNLLTYCSANSPLVLRVSVVLFRKTSASPRCFSATAGSVFLNRLFAVELISLVPDVKVWVRLLAPAVKRLAVLANVRAAEDDAEAEVGAASRVVVVPSDADGSSAAAVESLVSLPSSLSSIGDVLSPATGAAADSVAVVGLVAVRDETPVAASVISCLSPATTCDILPRMSDEAVLTDSGKGGKLVLRPSTFLFRVSKAVERSCWTVWASSVRSLRVTETNSFISFFPISINLFKEAPQADHEDLDEAAAGAEGEEVSSVVGAEARAGLVLGLSFALLVAPSSGLMNWKRSSMDVY